MSSIKNECSYKVITTCHSKLDTYTIKIKCGDHNPKTISTYSNATYQREPMKDDIKLKIFIHTQVDTYE